MLISLGCASLVLQVHQYWARPAYFELKFLPQDSQCKKNSADKKRKEKAHGFSKDFPLRLETSSNQKVSQVCCLCPPRTHLIEGDKVYVQKRAAAFGLWPLLAFADEVWSQLAFPGDVCKVYFAKLAESSRKKVAKSFQPLSSATAGDIRLFSRFQFLFRGEKVKKCSD